MSPLLVHLCFVTCAAVDVLTRHWRLWSASRASQAKMQPMRCCALGRIFQARTTDKGRKAASNASSAMFGGTAFAMKVSAEGLQASMSMLVKKVEEAADDLWFLAAPPPRMCQHLLR